MVKFLKSNKEGITLVTAIMLFAAIVIAGFVYTEKSHSQVPQTKSGFINNIYTQGIHYLVVLDSCLVQGQFRFAPYDTLNPGATANVNLYGRNNNLLFNSSGNITRTFGLMPGTMYTFITTATTDTISRGNNIQMDSARFFGSTTHASITFMVVDTFMVEIAKNEH
jgi:hypothetical protein